MDTLFITVDREIAMGKDREIAMGKDREIAMGKITKFGMLQRTGLAEALSPDARTRLSNREDRTLTWTRITDPETVAGLLPAWFGRRMIGLRGSFGLLLTTGDVLRLTSIAAAHQSSEGNVLLDVLLDDAGVPDGIDLAWRPKHFLGAPVQGASVATVNLAHIVAAVEFTVAEMAVNPEDKVVPFRDEIEGDPAARGATTEAIGQTAA